MSQYSVSIFFLRQKSGAVNSFEKGLEIISKGRKGDKHICKASLKLSVMQQLWKNMSLVLV